VGGVGVYRERTERKVNGRFEHSKS
jgi:hypothetical protein